MQDCDCCDDDVCRVCGGDADDDFHKNLDKVPNFSKWPDCPVCGRNVGEVAYVTGSFTSWEPSAEMLEHNVGSKEKTLYCDYCWYDVWTKYKLELRLKKARIASKQFVGLSGYKG